MKREILMLVAFATLVCSNEVDDVEQKKRGAGKPSSLNSIPTGAGKPDYTYNIYSSASQQSSPSSYQPVPNSFYPSQASQYYSPSSSPSDSSHYSPQPQLNLIPPSSSQFVPLNYISNSGYSNPGYSHPGYSSPGYANTGYQSKFQLIPSKSSSGNIQLTLVPQASSYPSNIVPFPQQLFAPNQAGQIHPQGQFGPLPQVPQNFQPIPLGGSYLGQPSGMVLVAQPNPSLYNNLLYQNPVQSFYNYYPSNSQAKYVSYGSQPPQSSEYDKLPGPVSQNIAKEDSDVHSTEYISQSEPNPNYKNYVTSRSSSSSFKN